MEYFIVDAGNGLWQTSYLRHYCSIGMGNATRCPGQPNILAVTAGSQSAPSSSLVPPHRHPVPRFHQPSSYNQDPHLSLIWSICRPAVLVVRKWHTHTQTPADPETTIKKKHVKNQIQVSWNTGKISRRWQPTSQMSNSSRVWLGELRKFLVAGGFPMFESIVGWKCA